MPDDLFQEADALEQAQDPWRMGHRRPWWQWNVVTLFVALFLLVWVRELFRLSQTATWVTCVGLLFAWLMGPAFYVGFSDQREDRPFEGTDMQGGGLGLRAGYMLAAFAMFGAVILTGGFIAAIFSLLAAMMYAAAVQKRS
jgi:hypothetical protein